MAGDKAYILTVLFFFPLTSMIKRQTARDLKKGGGGGGGGGREREREREREIVCVLQLPIFSRCDGPS